MTCRDCETSRQVIFVVGRPFEGQILATENLCAAGCVLGKLSGFQCLYTMAVCQNRV